ncbi:sodium-translocating pyrophosphatase [Oceanotoga sp. DSM 15011]|uniref:Putative K(+)-stimulated pyrophosphate-energized sodium pump n=1 Tax=Oceanotoga teriensis TaxID=515440 RepID=A0AA45HJ47_9BACT|nr:MULTISPECIES: sodium-translocating pyrophosphatase [Oceanotoga]MDO7976218.1 sodium-translocating pyrophosphatase [Oceanotoga teriensis]PWJ95415.1 K(+)-stimulated pyrophosphate-energized sodium pump [Oceanotoga teriensis]UYP01054.1 sodium-translocating pyrophosphatase [Oceanotoga sp. DSM 15011]
MQFLWFLLIVPLLALLFARINYKGILKLDEGTSEMKEVSKAIRIGANAFLKHEMTTILFYVIIIGIVLSVIIEWYVGVAFAIGAFMSAMAGVVGMKSATQTNVRVANTARNTEDISSTLKVAFKGGSVMGLAVAGFALSGMILIYLIFGHYLGQLDPENMIIKVNWLKINYIPFTMTVSGYALGCSLIAMFDRVGGGIYTKAADMGADLVGKTELELDEDDPRNPAAIADNVGDNVGDVAGLGADLLESYIGAIISSVVLVLYTQFLLGDSNLTHNSAINLTLYPLIFMSIGLVSAMIGIFYILKSKGSSNPHKDLNRSLTISAGLTILFSFIMTFFYLDSMTAEELKNIGFVFGKISPWVASIAGIFSGIFIGLLAEYYTSDDYKPTQTLSKFAKGGPAIVISKGLALGMKSVFLPVGVLMISILFSYEISGLYGVAMAAAGMLSFVAATVTVDSYGPIADNAGGIAEMAHLPKKVRDITDKLDSVGNTTAAVGKGFAIGSAGLAALSLFASYIYSGAGPQDAGIGDLTHILNLNIVNSRTIGGALFGAALPYFFSAFLIDAVVKAANKMVDEVRRQFKEIPGLMEGTAKPDYERCIKISSEGSLKEIKIPAMISVFTPIVTGFIFGVDFVGGLLVGTTLSGIMLAIFSANSGGAWDNAKKYIEKGNIQDEKKGGEAHKASVVGDTVGDPLKDTVGPSLDILIKIMSVSSLITVSIFKVYHLF